MFKASKQMTQTYLSRRKADLDKLNEAFMKDDIEVFNTIGHQIAGNARNFGFDDLEPLGIEMESLQPTDLKSKAPQIMEKFKNFIESQSL